jgi:hypothetical protein
MLPFHVALVPETTEVSTDELHQVSSAISVQITRDFGRVWSVDASIDPFLSRAQVPAGYWTVSIKPSDSIADAGFHTTDSNQPEAFVRYATDWGIRASHEVLEMLADPFGNRTTPGVHPDGSGRTVEFLVEVCDPCEGVGYDVNGVRLAEFFTPRYFDLMPAAGVQYSFTGAITQPRQVLPGGYLSWQDPADKSWWQLQDFAAGPHIVQVDASARGSQTLREFMDGATRAMRAVPLAKPRRRKPRTAKH